MLPGGEGLAEPVSGQERPKPVDLVLRTNEFAQLHGCAALRDLNLVEFVAVDLNGDGNVTDPDEGFMRETLKLAADAGRRPSAGGCGRSSA